MCLLLVSLLIFHVFFIASYTKEQNSECLKSKYFDKQLINPRPHSGAEGYCNQVFCLYMKKMSGQITTLGLRSSYQKTWNYTRIKIKHMLIQKPFGYKVMTNFTTGWLPFHDFLKTSGIYQKSTWKHNSSCLKAIAVELQLEIKLVLNFLLMTITF